MISDTGENVGDFAPRRDGMTNAISSKQRKSNFSRNFPHCLIARFFFAIEMTLEFGIDIPFAKHIH